MDRHRSRFEMTFRYSIIHASKRCLSRIVGNTARERSTRPVNDIYANGGNANESFIQSYHRSLSLTANEDRGRVLISSLIQLRSIELANIY